MPTAPKNKAAAKAARMDRAADAARQREQLRGMTDALAAEGHNAQAFDLLFDLIESLQKDNARLLYRLSVSTRALYGRRSEKLNAEQLGQLVLALGGTEEQAAQEDPPLPAPPAPSECGEESASDSGAQKTPKRRRPNHHGRSALSPDLPRTITVVPVPPEERLCVHCHEEMAVIDHIDHETIEYKPASIEVRVERREKRACQRPNCRQDITTAPRHASRPYERRAGLSLLAHLVESKCDDALPIHRQRDQLRRLGFDVPLTTLYGYWDYATSLLVPVAEGILSTVLGEPVVGVDDTKLDYLDPGDPRGKQRGHLWCFVGGSDLVAFTFTEDWTAEAIAPWLFAIDGYIQCDDYAGYGSTIEDNEGVERILVPPERRLGCMMHVRRRFHRAFQGGHLGAAVGLKLIGELYKVEEQARVQGLCEADRGRLRSQQSLPLLTQFDAWVDETKAAQLPSSPLGSAARYAEGQRPFIQRCFSDGRFEIDNGRVEREIRRPAIGRRNFLFSGSADAAKRLAAAYTVVLSARHVGVPVREYLIEILGRVADGWPARRLGDLFPDRWRAGRPGPSRNEEAQ